MANSKTTDILRFYFSKEKGLQQTLYSVETLFYEESIKGGGTSLKPKALFRPQLTPFQLLSHLRNSMQKTIQDISVDYITLVRRCETILKKIWTELKTLFPEVKYEFYATEKGALEPGYAFMCFDILEVASKA